MQNSHPYLRAYLAGIALPTVFLLVIAAGFTIAVNVFEIPVRIERAIVFPMAVVPNVWGIWNMLHVRFARVSLGVHGALLVLVLAPSGYALGRLLEIPFVSAPRMLMAIPLPMIFYYLVWKHLVGRLNAMLGISAV